MAKIYRKRGNKLNEVVTFDSACTRQENQPLVYDATDGSVHTTTHIGCLNADDVSVGNLTVTGQAIIQEQVTDTIDSNTLVLRSNADAGLTGTENSGVIIHNYNGSEDLYAVTDNTGTFRVGTAVSTTTTYAYLRYNEVENKWYSTAPGVTPAVEVTPVGSPTSWDSVVTSGDDVEYTNIVFSVIDRTSLEPLTTRDESTAMEADYLTKWNDTEEKIITTGTSCTHDLCTNGNITVTCNACINNNITVDCNACICGTETVTGEIHSCTCVTAPTACISDDLYVSGDINNCCANSVIHGYHGCFDGNVTIAGSLTADTLIIPSITSDCVKTVENTANCTFYPSFVQNNHVVAGANELYTDGNLQYNPASNTLCTDTYVSDRGIVQSAISGVTAADLGLTANTSYSLSTIVSCLQACCGNKAVSYTFKYENASNPNVLEYGGAAYNLTFEKLDNNDLSGTWSKSRWLVTGENGVSWTVVGTTGATAGSITWTVRGHVVDQVCVASVNNNQDFPIIFSTCQSTPSSFFKKTLYNDSLNQLMYNPSTNTLKTCCINANTSLSQGNLSYKYSCLKCGNGDRTTLLILRDISRAVCCSSCSTGIIGRVCSNRTPTEEDSSAIVEDINFYIKANYGATGSSAMDIRYYGYGEDNLRPVIITRNDNKVYAAMCISGSSRYLSFDTTGACSVICQVCLDANGVYKDSSGCTYAITRGGSLATLCVNASSSNVWTADQNTNYPIVFSTYQTTPTISCKTLYNDSANNLMYNPGTNTLTTGTICATSFCGSFYSACTILCYTPTSMSPVWFKIGCISPTFALSTQYLDLFVDGSGIIDTISLDLVTATSNKPLWKITHPYGYSGTNRFTCLCLTGETSSWICPVTLWAQVTPYRANTSFNISVYNRNITNAWTLALEKVSSPTGTGLLDSTLSINNTEISSTFSAPSLSVYNTGNTSSLFTIQGNTSADLSYGPTLKFSSIDASQNACFIFTDYDSYLSGASVTLAGDQGSTWFCSQYVKSNTEVTCSLRLYHPAANTDWKTLACVSFGAECTGGDTHCPFLLAACPDANGINIAFGQNAQTIIYAGETAASNLVNFMTQNGAGEKVVLASDSNAADIVVNLNGGLACAYKHCFTNTSIANYKWNTTSGAYQRNASFSSWNQNALSINIGPTDNAICGSYMFIAGITNTVKANHTVVIGQNNTTGTPSSIPDNVFIIGNENNASYCNCYRSNVAIIGACNFDCSHTSWTTTLGFCNINYGTANVSIGYGHKTYNAAIAIGDNGATSKYNTTCDCGIRIGSSTVTSVTGTSSIAIGTNTGACETYSVAIGHNAKANSVDAIVIGDNACTSVNGYAAVVIGAEACGLGAEAIAIGDNACSCENAVAIGVEAYSVENSTAIGYSARSGGHGFLALGKCANSYVCQNVSDIYFRFPFSTTIEIDDPLYGRHGHIKFVIPSCSQNRDITNFLNCLFVREINMGRCKCTWSASSCCYVPTLVAHLSGFYWDDGGSSNRYQRWAPGINGRGNINELILLNTSSGAGSNLSVCDLIVNCGKNVCTTSWNWGTGTNIWTCGMVGTIEF